MSPKAAPLTRSGLELARCIDHTLLKPTAVRKDFLQHCNEARTHQFFSVCVPSFWAPFCANQLHNTNVRICTVIGFPMGYTTKQVKALETSQALSDGASEFDTVLNISALKSGDVQLVEDDIRAVVDAAKGNTVKVILETCYLTPTEIDLACDISLAAGAHFVKTSTGFGSAGATESAVKAMVSRVGSRGQVKASGGIRDFQIANKMLELGATRLGTSNSVDIINKVSHVKDGSY